MKEKTVNRERRRVNRILKGLMQDRHSVTKTRNWYEILWNAIQEWFINEFNKEQVKYTWEINRTSILSTCSDNIPTCLHTPYNGLPSSHKNPCTYRRIFSQQDFPACIPRVAYYQNNTSAYHFHSLPLHFLITISQIRSE